MSEKQKIKMTRAEKAREIYEKAKVRVTQTKHITEIMHMAKEPRNLEDIKKLDKDHYLVISEGEILEYNHSENRGQNILGVKRTVRQIRNLINNNFDGAGNERFITTTYAENMMDAERLYSDHEKFIKKLRYRYGGLDYLTVMEPQRRGAWHGHTVIKFYTGSLYIENNRDIWPLWGHGFTKTTGVGNVDNVGAYLSAYLADMELNEDTEKDYIRLCLERGGYGFEEYNKLVEEPDGTKTPKRFAKGARLYLYPPGFNMYRCSKGIKRPETVIMTYGEAKKIVGSGPADYSRTVDLTDEENKPLNSITYEQYNSRRIKKQ